MIEAGPILLVDAGLSVPEPDAPQVAMALAEAGYMVQSTDVESAEQAARTTHPALVVVDADAPGAMRLLSALRKMTETARAPILLVGVAGKTVASARDAILRGADAFYPRPIDARRLLLKVETYLGLPDDAPRVLAPAPPKPEPQAPLPSIPQLPLEPDPGPARPEATFVLSDAPMDGGPSEEGSEPRRTRTLPPVGGEATAEGDQEAVEPDAAGDTPADGRTGTMPFMDAVAQVTEEEAPRVESAVEGPERPFDAGLSDELRGVLRSMERKLFPDAPPLVVPDIASDDPDELVPSDLLVGLEPFEPDLDEEGPAVEDGGAAKPPTSPEVRLEETMDLRAPTVERRVGDDVAPPDGTPTPKEPMASESDEASEAPPHGTQASPRDDVPALPERRPGRRDSMPPPPAGDVQEAEGPQLSIHGLTMSSGELGREDPVRVFTAALAARITGRVRFRRGRAEKLVHLIEGRPTVASSNLVEDRLVEGMYRTGRLPREAYERVRATIAGTGRRAGAILVEMGLLKREELVPVVRSHLEEVLFSIYGWEEGAWVTEPGVLDDREHIQMETPAAALVLEGARLRYGPRRVERTLGGAATTLAPRAAGIVPIAEARLLPEEAAILEAFDGRRTLGQVLENAGGTMDELGASLWCLVCLGFLEVRARGMPSEAVESPGEVVGASSFEPQIERRRVEERLALARVADYFVLLGISRTASGHEIRRAYLELIRAFDPARFAVPPLSDLVGAAHEILAALDDAYEVLRDGALRDAYRSHLASP